MTKTAIWLRVSTDQQNTENQLRPLEGYAQRRGLEHVATFDISNVSAFRGQQEKYLSDVLAAARLGKFHILLVWALDRLSRGGPEEILRIVRKFNEFGCEVWSLQEPWTEVQGELRELLLSVVGWVAAMESRRKSERTKAGLERAKANGSKLGRPKGSKDQKRRKRSGYYARYAN